MNRGTLKPDILEPSDHDHFKEDSAFVMTREASDQFPDDGHDGRPYVYCRRNPYPASPPLNRPTLDMDTLPCPCPCQGIIHHSTRPW